MKEIVYVIFFSVLVISYLYSGMYIYNNFGKELDQTSSTYIIIFFIMYVCLFLVLCNIVILSLFYNIIKKQKGVTGPQGIQGDQGERGNNGECQVFCLSDSCGKKIRQAIKIKFSILAENSYKKNKMSKLERKYYKSIGGMNISKDIVDSETKIVIKTKLKNDLLEKMVSSICQSNNYDTLISAFKPREEDIIELLLSEKYKDKFLNKPSIIKFPYEKEYKSKSKKNRIIKFDSEIIRKILENEYIMTFNENSENSTDLINFKLEKDLIKKIKEMSVQIKKELSDNKNKKFTPDNVQKYIIKIFNEWIELIYNALDNPYIDFFNNKYATNSNTNWKNNKNPFIEIMKYDLYHWGLTRQFFPAIIKVDENKEFYNYLPEGGKPPLHYIETNDLKWVYDSKLNREGTGIQAKIMEDIEYIEEGDLEKIDYDSLPDDIKKLYDEQMAQSRNSNSNSNIKQSDGFINYKEGFQDNVNSKPISAPPRDNEIISVWKNKNNLYYKNNYYYPVGTLLIQNSLISPEKKHSTSQKYPVDYFEVEYKSGQKEIGHTDSSGNKVDEVTNKSVNKSLPIHSIKVPIGYKLELNLKKKKVSTRIIEVQGKQIFKKDRIMVVNFGTENVVKKYEDGKHYIDFIKKENPKYLIVNGVYKEIKIHSILHENNIKKDLDLENNKFISLESYSIIKDKNIVQDTKFYKDTTSKFKFSREIKTNNYKQKELGSSLKGFSFLGPKDSSILMTGDLKDPKDYKLLANNKDSFERSNLSIFRPECPDKYDSMGDIAVSGFEKPNKKNNFKCVPSICLDSLDMKNATNLTFNNKKNIYTFINKDVNEDKYNYLKDKGYNFFRYNESGPDEKKLYKIKDSCLRNTSKKSLENKFGRIGIGWHGRPYRNPKYSIFSYLSQFPEAIISSMTTGEKFYIIHTELFDNNSDPTALYKTSAKNLYYILGYNPNSGSYDRCYSINMDDNDDGSNLIKTRIRTEEECYWIIEPVEDNSHEIRLKSKKTGRYFNHLRDKKLVTTIANEKVFDEQVDLERHRTDLLKTLINKKIVTNNFIKKYNKSELKTIVNFYDSTIFVNIKSAFGVNASTALESTQYKGDIARPRLDSKFYKDDKNNVHPKHNKYLYPKRGMEL